MSKCGLHNTRTHNRLTYPKSLFTVPVSLSETISSTGLSSLQGLLSQANLSSTFNNANSFTLFTPSNAALAAAANTINSTTSPAVLQKVLQNHAISNFVGYLPDLVDGASYTTLSGNILTISVKNKAYFVNGVQIISTNTITANGVAHVINGVCFPFFFFFSFLFSFPSLFRGLCCGV